MAQITATDADPMRRLLDVMGRLRDRESGCPWDIEQTYDTIAPYTIEEAYEVADAISRRDWTDLREELGDLLLQVVYHAQMACEDGLFDFDDVARGVTEKMISRHPHVFGDDDRNRSAANQTLAWEAQKQAERAASGAEGVLDGVALGLPALTRALKLQKRAARIGFDWPDPEAALDKVAEETGELAAARRSGDDDAIAAEFGDLLFTLVNVGRHLGVDPEAALRRSNDKFTRRFEHIERDLATRGLTAADAETGELEDLWNDAKSREELSD